MRRGRDPNLAQVRVSAHLLKVELSEARDVDALCLVFSAKVSSLCDVRVYSRLPDYSLLSLLHL